MAGLDRPTCSVCGKHYKFNYVTEQFLQNCNCSNSKAEYKKKESQK